MIKFITALVPTSTICVHCNTRPAKLGDDKCQLCNDWLSNYYANLLADEEEAMHDAWLVEDMIQENKLQDWTCSCGRVYGPFTTFCTPCDY